MNRCTKCGREFGEPARYTGLGVVNGRVRCYCPSCWRKVEWARAHAGWNKLPKPGQLAREREQRQHEAEERRERLYWERVDNYRELGYDPN